jgi:hypothetical protein
MAVPTAACYLNRVRSPAPYLHRTPVCYSARQGSAAFLWATKAPLGICDPLTKHGKTRRDVCFLEKWRYTYIRPDLFFSNEVNSALQGPLRAPVDLITTPNAAPTVPKLPPRR